MQKGSKMGKRKRDDAAVEVYPDHEVISPPHKLRKAVVRADKTASIDLDAIARAEEALKVLSIDFDDWMQIECDRLEAERLRCNENGYTDIQTGDFFLAAHDIKGEAATFGYPLVGHVAFRLCRLLEHTPEPTQIPRDLVDRHVAAIRAIIREKSVSDAEKTAVELAHRLQEVTEDFLQKVNAHRPDYLENPFAPPLVPHD